jgi:hypothetical protein
LVDTKNQQLSVRITAEMGVRRMRKSIIVLLLMLLVISFSVISLELARISYFYPRIPKPDYPPPLNRTEAWQQDLDYFQTYIQLNRPYTDETRAGAQALASSLSDNIDILSDAELKLGMQRRLHFPKMGIRSSAYLA